MKLYLIPEGKGNIYSGVSEMENTVATLMEQKQSGDKITMLTAYDYTTARI